jgi:hypothetical protein
LLDLAPRWEGLDERTRRAELGDGERLLHIRISILALVEAAGK